jgi:nitrogen fixation-related uncharacterized protein
MKRLLECFLATAFIFMLGNSVVGIPLYVANVFGFRVWNYLGDFQESLNGSGILFITIGIATVAWAIYDGQFIDRRDLVKKSHWINRGKEDKVD